MTRLLQFEPLYQERVWGGRNLENKLGRILPENKVIGESWELVDRLEAQSIVATGPYTGQTLRQLMQEETAWLMGPGWNPAHPFPILVKWLDCQERLSLQVHPPASVAPALAGEPKTENWYIADATPGASLMAGLRRGVTREAFAEALRNQTLEDCVHMIPVENGESLLVPSGRIHAIGGGNLILEIQQNSDTTYRVYDWGREGLDGKPRQLHIQESMSSIDFDDFEPATIKPQTGDQLLADVPEFRLRKWELTPGDAPRVFKSSYDTRLLSVVSGAVREMTDGDLLRKGDQALLPWDEPFSFVAEEATVMLVTDRFCRKIC